MGISGNWKNQRGSTMELQVSGDTITGTYKSVEGGDASAGQSGAVFGKVVGDLVSFIVIFKDSHGEDDSIVSWTGRLFPAETHKRTNEAKPERIATVWCLARRTSSERDKSGTLTAVSSQDWNHILTNADVFTRA